MTQEQQPPQQGGPPTPTAPYSRNIHAGPIEKAANGEHIVVTRSDQMRSEGQLENEPAMWLPEHDYTPSEDRSVIRSLRDAPGVSGFGVVPTEPASWDLLIEPGRAIIDGTINPLTQGSYALYSPRTLRVTVEPAHPTLVRYDVVILHVVDQENSTEEGFGWRPEVVTGEPGVTDAPELPPNSLPLVGLWIPAGGTRVTRTNYYPPLWQHTSADLRRPASTPLFQLTDIRRQFDIPGYGAVFFNFDLNPSPLPGWRKLQLWAFPVVMEISVIVHLYHQPFVGNRTSIIINPRHQLSVAGEDQSLRLNTSAYGNEGPPIGAPWVYRDLQLFESGQVPAWGLYLSAATGGMVTVPLVVLSTTLWPRSVNAWRWGSVPIFAPYTPGNLYQWPPPW